MLIFRKKLVGKILLENDSVCYVLQLLRVREEEKVRKLPLSRQKAG